MLVTSKGKAKTTKELIDASIGVLIDALESGHSEVLTAYLSQCADTRQGWKTFRGLIEKSIQRVHAVYPAANVNLTRDGLLLLPSPTSVPRTKAEAVSLPRPEVTPDSGIGNSGFRSRKRNHQCLCECPSSKLHSNAN